eukprot:10748407-Ditylum_brightwellii.AAC.1
MYVRTYVHLGVGNAVSLLAKGSVASFVLCSTVRRLEIFVVASILTLTNRAVFFLCGAGNGGLVREVTWVCLREYGIEWGAGVSWQ